MVKWCFIFCKSENRIWLLLCISSYLIFNYLDVHLTATKLPSKTHQFWRQNSNDAASLDRMKNQRVKFQVSSFKFRVSSFEFRVLTSWVKGREFDSLCPHYFFCISFYCNGGEKESIVQTSFFFPVFLSSTFFRRIFPALISMQTGFLDWS